MDVFDNRIDAGRQLAARLEPLRGTDIVILGLPRGGVPVAAEVAKALHAPLDVIVVRKLGVPFQPEVAMGAIGEGGVKVLDARVLRMARVSDADLANVERLERATLEDRSARFRRGRDRIDLTGRTAVIVDDGIATGSTARAACQVARRLGAARVVLAVPVGPKDTVEGFTEADEVVCVAAPSQFLAVGYHYRDFSPTTDDEVIVLLDAAARRMQAGLASEAADSDLDVVIPVDGVTVEGHLRLPEPATAVVVFAHGSGSSRHSPRNRFVADVLYEAGLGTLLLDLLTPGEEANRANVFNIELLARRLGAVTEWLAARQETAGCTIGYFGASTGAGAALRAAGELGERISAVVSRGGRPELAGPILPAVTAPTLLIVGGADTIVLDLNRRAQAELRCENRLAVVAGATHLFEEPGALAEVAILARDWFVTHLRSDDETQSKGSAP
ncbi:phosphoribosyltransferase [Lacisediminihabitans profunda]|uniref:Phosphoribosyltransferase n=1 Tax=Lacisediminihabitans profunda TaxID=2594790 RepID=A0A5C8URY7_9MICO|nr:phosphoribosyltransferase [Lacisediminihabitans profunda]TXN31007.1 phosphoribosyltransferase [Lacisediminihabitans profunda]